MEFQKMLERLPTPMQRALSGAGIDSIETLAQFAETDLLKLHGVGVKGLALLQKLLSEQGLKLRD